MNLERIIFTACFCLLSLCLQAQKTKKVHGEYVYHAPENVTLEDAKRTALERAKVQALADAFGTLVSQSNSTIVRNTDGVSSSDFLSLGGSEVKGEWIETIGEPEFDISFTEGMLVVRVSVTGRAREIVSSKIDFEAKLLRNGTEPKFESSEFRNGDDLYLYFKSPVDGYLAVYLLDETTMQVYCLLPYRNSGEGSVKIKHDVPYVFFSTEKANNNKAEVDEYVMTCAGKHETNVIYVIFSTNPFVKANLNISVQSLNNTSYEDFNKWLVKSRNIGNDFQILKNIIEIRL